MSSTIAEGSSLLAPPVVVLAGLVLVEFEVVVGVGAGVTAGTLRRARRERDPREFRRGARQRFRQRCGGRGRGRRRRRRGGGAWATVAVTVRGLGVVLFSAA